MRAQCILGHQLICDLHSQFMRESARYVNSREFGTLAGIVRRKLMTLSREFSTLGISLRAY